jgi:hypothetical protein
MTALRKTNFCCSGITIKHSFELINETSDKIYRICLSLVSSFTLKAYNKYHGYFYKIVYCSITFFVRLAAATPVIRLAGPVTVTATEDPAPT